MRRKITALIALAAMVMTMIPSVVFAGEAKVELTKADGTKATYETVEAAMKDVDKEPVTIKLLGDYAGNGIVVKDGQNVTFDLDGHSWDVTGTVGSQGTQTNAFQLLKGSKVVFKNGLVTSKTAQLLFQNYAELTLDGIEAEIKTPGDGQYIMSNNNGKTVVRNSVITADKGDFAMDSYSFEPYTGGDVVIEETSEVNGNVQVVNGGKLDVQGTVNGNIEVLNDSYGPDKTPVLTVTGGVVDGDITVKNNGKATVTDGFVVGMAVEGDKASATMLSGLIEKVGKGVVVNNTDIALLEAVDGSEVTAVGADYIAFAIDIAAEEDALAKVTFLSVADDSKYDIPAGVVVVNDTEGDVVVNGDTVAKGETITVKDPETPAPNPGDKPETKPEAKPNAPQTGDTTAMIPLAVLIMATAAMAVVYRKKNN